MTEPQNKLLDVLNLVNNYLVHFEYQFYQQTDGVATSGPPASSTPAEIYLQAHEQIAISVTLHLPNIWKHFIDDFYSILKRTHLENVFHHINLGNVFHNINNLHQSIKLIMDGKSNGELAFLDTSLKLNNEKISLLLHRKPTHTDQCLHCNSHHQTI